MDKFYLKIQKKIQKIPPILLNLFSVEVILKQRIIIFLIKKPV